MRKILLFIFVVSTTIIFAQAPQGINYQGIARNSGGTVLSTVPIGIKLDLHQGSAGGPVVFSETHSPVTNQFGLFTLSIGSNNGTGFSAINWGGGPYFLEVSIDPTGGSSYSPLAGIQQFMSVPYALYAQTSGNSSPTPTISINAPNIVTGSGGFYNITVPSQTLSVAGNQVSISNGNTITIPTGTTYSAGNGIDINAGVITGTANIVGTGATTVNGTYPNLTINTPTTQTYSAGLGIDISAGGVISNTLTPATPTITSSGIAVVTPTTGNTFNVSVPQPTLSYNNSTNVLSLTHDGSTVATATLVGMGTNTTSIVGSGLATVTPTTGSTFTVSVPNPTLTLGAGALSISNGNSVILPVQTLSINSNLLSISGPGGNTVTLPSATAYSLTSNSNTLTLSNGSTVTTATVPVGTTYVGTTNNVTVTGNTINLAATGVTTNTYGTNATNAVPTFSVDNFGRLTTASQYTPNITGDVIGTINTSTVSKIRGINVSPTAPTVGQVLQFTAGSWTPGTPAVQTLSLSGSVLSSGPTTNSVSLASLPGLWSASSTTAIIQTNTTNNVGIGMTSPAPQYKLDVVATAGNSVTIHGLNSGATDAFAGVYGENTSGGIGVYAQSSSGKGVFGKSTSGSGVYGESTTGDAGKFILSGVSTTGNAVNAQTNGTSAALFAKTYNTTATALAAKIEGNVDIQNTGSPTGRLISAVQTNSVSDGFGLDMTNTNNNANALNINHLGRGSAGYFTINNAANTSNALNAVTNGIGNAGFFAVTDPSNSNHAVQGNSSGLSSAIFASNSNTTSSGSHALHANAVSGSAIFAINTSTMASTIYATNSGAGNVIFSSASEGVAYYGTNASTTGSSVMELASNGGGVALQVYKNSTTGVTGPVATFANNQVSNPSDAVVIVNGGAGTSLSSTNNNASVLSYAGMFYGGLATNGKTNTSSGFAFKAFDNSSSELFGVRNDGHVGINATSPAHRLTVVESSPANAAIFGSNISATSNPSGHGIMGLTNNGNASAAAVFGQNTGVGPSFYGIKGASETGIGGRFELLNNGNSADAVMAKTDGSGAALHAVSGTTANMVSTVGLWLENGHLKSTGATVSTGAMNVSGGFITPSFAPILTNCTDVKGTFSFTTSVTGIVAGAYIELQIMFAKGYSVPPTVVVTSASDLQGLNYMVMNITSTSFFVRVYRTANTSVSTPTTIINGSIFKFNYMVIE
ncbi:MAG: hypothetical protein V4580_02950 [Bacteroidota bacterium]